MSIDKAPEEISFGEWLRQRRRMLDLTQQAFADQVGCARITLRRIESGARKPSKELARILLSKLGVPEIEWPQWIQFARSVSGFPAKSGNSFTNTQLTNLPAPLTSFIGREKEQIELASLLVKNRLITLTGLGGIGKTRLSIQVASTLRSDFPNGAWLVELAPISDPMLVPQTIVTTLGLIEQAGRPLLTTLIDFLRPRQVLLVLDNCEHLIQACAQVVEPLLRSCPKLYIFATSRESLGVNGEVVYLVPPLTAPNPMHTAPDTLSDYESVQLFVDRSQSALTGFKMTDENMHAIAQLCHDLDGIPLALELAAARVKLLRVQEIVERLEDRFRLLTSGLRTVLPRHQTLHAMIDWSHDLLSEPERVLLRRLCVFAGGWSLEAAESICGGNGIDREAILDLLTQLFNKSLIIAKREQGKETRYQLLETIRQYAREKLWGAGEGKLWQQKHMVYFVEFAERAQPNLRAWKMVMWLDRLENELDNIRVALAWALESDIEAELRLASALYWFWQIRGHKNEGIDWLERGLSIEAMERGEQPLWTTRALIRGKALNGVGSLMSISFESRQAPERLEESRALFQELGPAGRQGMAIALCRLGALLSGQLAEDKQGRSLLKQSLTLFRELGDKFGMAECLMLLSEVARNDNDCKQAIVFAEEGLALRKEIGDRDGIAMALSNLGDLAFRQDAHEKAIALYEESIAIFREVGNRWATGFTLSAYGDICFSQGDYEQATKIYEEAAVFAQNLGDRFLIAFNSYNLGIIAWLQGGYARASQMITESLAVFRDVGYHWFVTSSLHALGDIALAQGDEERAAGVYESALVFGQEVQLNIGCILALAGLGKVAWAKGDYVLARQRFEEALRMNREEDLNSAPLLVALYGLGRVAQSQFNYDEARVLYAEAVRTHQQRINSPLKWGWPKTYDAGIAYLLSAFGELAVAQNQMKRSARLLGAAESLYTALRFEMSSAERAEHDQAVAAARAGLGEEKFAAVWVEGKAMKLEEAITYAVIDA